MSFKKAILYALGTTIVSALALTIVNGPPTWQGFLSNSGLMFVIAYFVFKYMSLKK